MFNIRWSTLVCAITAGLLAEAIVLAKDEPKPKGNQPAAGNPPAAQPPNHSRPQPPPQPSGQLPQFKANSGGSQPRETPKLPQPHNPEPGVTNPGAQPKVALPQPAPSHVQPTPGTLKPQQPQPQLPRETPKIHLPANTVPGTQPKVSLPQPGQPSTQPHGNPKVPGNPPQPDGRPKLPLPPNAVPGTGLHPGTGPQPKVGLPGQSNPQVDTAKHGIGLPGYDPSKLPLLKPSTGTPGPKIGPHLDPKLNLNNGTGHANGRDNPAGQKNPSPIIPGPGNQPKIGNLTLGQPREHLPMQIDHPIVGKQKQAIPLTIPKNGGQIHKINDQVHKSGDSIPKDPKGLPIAKNQDQLQSLLNSKDHRELRQNLELLQHSPDLSKHPQLSHINLDKISGLHQDRLQQAGAFHHWQQANLGQQLDLGRQFQLQRQGDLTRQMNLSANVINAGGWQNRYYGAIAPTFTTSSFSVWYAGGGCYPTHCWSPRWSPWVSWCWWDSCVPFYDPRPIYCRPIIYQPCQPWIAYQYPVWQPLPMVTCGTWVNVEPIVIPAGLDLQLLAIRFVDNGHSEQNLGPRYRVWVRNNSPVQVTTPFSVLALADNDVTPSAGVPQAGMVIPTMDIGEIKPIDIRLPLEANRLGVTPEGHRVPFNFLHVLVDSHQQIAEMDETNNGSVVARTDILPVDPAAFSTDQTAATPGGTLSIAGEGFGPEPGRVLVSVDGQNTEAVIQGWYDLGIRFTVPSYTLTGTVDAEVLVVRGDGAVSNPLDIQLAPPSMLGQTVEIPMAPTPEPPQ